MAHKPQWETVSYKRWDVMTDHSYFEDLTRRLKVPNGWIVESRYSDESGITNSMCFVPDSNRNWQLEDEKLSEICTAKILSALIEKAKQVELKQDEKDLLQMLLKQKQESKTNL